MQLNPITLVIGLVFSPLAALMAFLITYDEYSHHYPNNRMPLKLATEAGIFTFIIFMAILAVIGYFLGNL